MNIANINSEARALVEATSTTYTDALLLIRVNNALEDIAALILEADGRWQWDDTNRTDFPIGLTTLVASQADYQLDSSQIKILGVSVKDVNGNWSKLQHIDADEDISGDRAEFMKTAGKPLFYDDSGASIVLYPAPDNGATVTLASGLKVYAQRTAELFTSAEVTTGTKVAGFASPFHVLLAYKAALPYAGQYKPERVSFIQNEITRLEKGLKNFYSHRNKDERQKVTVAPISFR